MAVQWEESTDPGRGAVMTVTTQFEVIRAIAANIVKLPKLLRK
jgi:hypothetical protein